ncbi:glycosyltransferase [Muricoccus radiodurans]|uniref:glycosyltransferase n=1 Tax=Muricoccus radiodurans TaxID=2231721 RepID=UPI003CEE2232
MRVLVISPTPSHPQDAGNRQRIHAMLSRLKGFGHRVEFLFVQRETVDGVALDAMRAAWDALILLPHDRKAERRTLEQTHAVDDWWTPELEAGIGAVAAAETYDLVLVEYVFLSRALDLFPAGTLKVIDTHDVFADRHLRLKALGLPAAFFHTTREEEGRGLDRADLVLAIQDDERAALEETTRTPVATLGFIPPASPAPPRVGDGWRIGYLGSGNPINGHAINRFLGNLDLAYLAEHRAVVQVAGGASGLVGPARPGLEPVGRVEEPGPFLAGLDLAVNPHEGGTGLKIKTVEALAHGRPVIGTAEAFAGLAARAHFHAAASAPATAALARRWVDDAAFRTAVAEESATLFRRYAAEVERQIAPFCSRESLERLIRRPRALLVTDIPFWRVGLGNEARITELVRAARGAMDLDLLHLGALGPEDAAAAARVLGPRGTVFDSQGSEDEDHTPPARLPLTPFERRSFVAAHLDAMTALLAERDYDLVILQYIRLSYLRHAGNMPALRVLDTHDLMSLRTLNFEHFEREHFLRIPILEEMEILSGFETVLAIQGVEHATIDGALPNRSLHLPHTVPELAWTDAARPTRRIVFIGGDSPMNRDGMRWFFEQVWPCVDEEGALLHVAGRVCESLSDLAANSRNLVLHGQVDDLGAFLDAADIGINPVFYGGGLKIKTVEYLCRGLPSVLTEEAAFGIGEGEGRAYLIARSRLEYIAHLQTLLRQPATRRRIGEEAFRLGRSAFGRPVATAALRGLAQIALAARSAAPLPAVS